MELEKRALSELKPSNVNVRKHTANQIKEFKKSIDAFDVIRPIVIDENNTILVGHGLFQALTEMGKEYADVLVKKGLAEKQKKKLLLADNKIYSLGIDDYTAIESILKELATDSDFEVPGYDSEILEQLYGIKSVEKEVESGAISQMTDISEPKSVVDADSDADDIPNPNEIEIEPPDKLQDQRKSAQEERKFVICSNCGEKIWL